MMDWKVACEMNDIDGIVYVNAIGSDTQTVYLVDMPGVVVEVKRGECPGRQLANMKRELEKIQDGKTNS